jgi:hypothetical protein
MRRALAFLTILMLPMIASGQSDLVIEYGAPAELKGVQRVFIDTGTDMEVRENIIRAIAKYTKGVTPPTVVSRPEDAEVFLFFAADSSTIFKGVQTQHFNYGSAGSNSVSSARYATVVHGTGQVLRPVAPSRVRLLLDFSDSRGSPFERRPSTNFGRKFAHEFMRAHGIEP